MNYHYSVFKEEGYWWAQMLWMPEEEVKRLHKFKTREEAHAQVREWKARFGE